MNYASLQMVPFASPAPLAAGPALDQAPLAERRRRPRPKKQKKQKPARRPNEADVIAPVPSTARISAARSYDDEYDDDDDSMDEFDKDPEMHDKHPPQQPVQQSPSTGVQKIEHVTRSWTPTTIIVAWTGMMLLAIVLSLDSLTVPSYQPYALSSFNAHSMLPALTTLQSILSATTKPVMAKIADVSGRSEALTVSLVAIALGFVINATSHSLGTMAAGQAFYAIGQVGIVFLQQIVAADTTTLANRALFSALLYSPPIVTAWVAGPMVEALVPANWRWGYGMWAIVVPIVSIPLLASIWRIQRTRAKTPRSSPIDGFISKWAQADIPGLALFVAGLVLLLLPMTLTVRFHNGWSSAPILAMIIAGTVSFTGFVLYDIYVAIYPILPLHLAKSRTVAAGCLTEALLFLSYYLWQPYLYSFLVVVNDFSPAAATNVGMAAPVVSAAVVGLAAAVVVKCSGHCKWVVVGGTLVKLVGSGLMIRFSNRQASLTQIVITQIIAGAGSGVVSIVSQTAVQSVASHDDVANVTTLYEAARAIGGAIGTAISGSIWTRLLLSKLEAHLPEASKSSAVAIQDSLTVATSFAVGSPERLAINKSYTEVMHILLVTSIAFVAASFLVSLAIENLNLKKVDQDGAQRGVIGRVNFRDWYRRKVSGK
ncbi:siderochrome-iron transporter MirC [Cordyceps fumosorosea ARSEF 2679]|uniref:Siderochrome-iron transporter MirC n=1 Tax=Cordyceps fumosorosea (strain ARSEF 2679) TaxID=1081104 RepID=A0A162JHR7_CORFA|nr:siderochrome-iron transporter MirC [Cordyceps fumosorosea ARSEF 2679]OAA69162.1 siderochrome-iron transporter MirC [Cordyceps fumosorosea ARSEF 2679]